MAKAGEKKAILERAEKERVKFLRLQFTDILGVIKNVEVPDRQFAEALDGNIMFDGSSIEGFVRIEESDMYLRPDLSTFQVFPWADPNGARVGRLICDIANPDGSPVRRLPAHHAEERHRARRRARLHDDGRARRPSSSCSFAATASRPPRRTTRASYFDLAPIDLGEDVRREIVVALEQMGMHVEAAHHEVAPGQHEIDFHYDDVLTTADNVSTCRFIVKNVALNNNLHATFMPKPIFGVNGSGMHTHQSLFTDGKNAFFDSAQRDSAEPDVPALRRRVAAARQGLLRDHQSAGEFVQAARARLRGADGDRVVREEPQSARARAGGARHRRRASSCACRIRRAIRISRWR